MILPEMKYADGITKSKQVKFGGLNRTAGATDGELADMRNLTSDHYPVLSPRERRTKLFSIADPGGFYCWDGLLWVMGEELYYVTEKDAVAFPITPGEKSFCYCGGFVVILPDMVCFDVHNYQLRSIASSWDGSTLTFDNGLRYGEPAAANAVSCEGVVWSDYFREGDAVEISGCTKHPENNMSAIIRQIDGDKLYFSENVFTLDGENGTEGYAEESALGNSLHIRRKAPALKYICEQDNRLWGCTEDTIYVSKLGDPFNWFVYDGLASDSWTLQPASSGVFTGVFSYRGHVTYFKEDQILKVYGSAPSNYEVIGSSTLGLMDGCGKSLAVAGETLFYLNRNGIIAYTGGIPQRIGQELGTERFIGAVAGSDGLKYFVCLQDMAGVWRLYVYDTQLRLWHKEDNLDVMGFVIWHNTFCCLTKQGEIWALAPMSDKLLGQFGQASVLTTMAVQTRSVCEPEDMVTWSAEFADFTEDEPNHKGVSKLQLRLELEEGAYVNVAICYDSENEWHHVRCITGESRKRSYYLPITPRRCDHYRIRLAGAGGCRVYSMVRESYTGSEYNTWR